MANDNDDGEFSPMPPLPLVANRDKNWRESFSPLGSFGSLEQEGGEDEDEYTDKNDDDGEDDDSRMTSNHSQNSLHAFREAEGDEVEVCECHFGKAPIQGNEDPYLKKLKACLKRGEEFSVNRIRLD
jgi:hypothetical protein